MLNKFVKLKNKNGNEERNSWLSFLNLQQNNLWKDKPSRVCQLSHKQRLFEGDERITNSDSGIIYLDENFT